MKIGFVKNILTLSILAIVVTPVVWADEPVKVGIQRSFVNLGFEIEPSFSERNIKEYGCYSPGKNNEKNKGSSWDSSYCVFGQDAVKGWKTTARTNHSDNYGNRREIELWKPGKGVDDSNKGVETATSDSKIYAEVNAHVSAALYQNICISQSDKLDWSFQHRQRESNLERIGFFISDEIEDSSSSNQLQPTTNDLSISNKYLFQSQVTTTLSSSWKTYSGEQVELKNYLLANQKAGVRAFGFEALQSDTEAKSYRGNWLDDIKLKLNPAVEFSSAPKTMSEGSKDGEYPIEFNLVGLVESDTYINFVIQNTKADLGGNKLAVYGKDYKIFDKNTNKEIIPTNTAPTTELLTTTSAGTDVDTTKDLYFAYKVSPNTNFASGMKVTNLVIKMLDDKELNGNRTVPIAFNKIQPTKVDGKDHRPVVTMSTQTCGETEVGEYLYTIQDDDVDLAVTKTLKNEILVPNQHVSYEIIVENKYDPEIKVINTAKRVVLKDTLLSNLISDSETEVVCESIENDDVKGVCPTRSTAKQAATELFSEKGLVIGDLPTKAKLKFTVSKLKLSSSDNGVDKYQGIVANQVIVITNGMDEGEEKNNPKDDNINDVNLVNNTAITKDLYPTTNDLMNADTNKTGRNLFVIDNNGEALWTKPIENQKAYFPLIIQNDSPASQDYKLIASSTAIARMIQSDFSALDQATITSFTSGLNIKFYAVEEGKCKAGLSGSDISQIKVSANSSASLCAEITASESATASTDIWFAIESLQTGLGDVIKDKVTYTAQVLRQLELVNDQKAQLNIGGTYVFTHRLFNKGTMDERGITLTLDHDDKDGFLYTLYKDLANPQESDKAETSAPSLDATDTIVISSSNTVSLEKGKHLVLFIKAQAPSTATNGMMSQVKLIAKPIEDVDGIKLTSLINTDTVFVGSNQVQVTKMQYKQPQCTPMSKEEVKKEENYSISSETIGASDCLIYKITIKNIGSEILKNIDVNDTYPAYTQKWELGQNILPMTSSGEVVEVKGDQVKTTILELLPQQEKSLYFGIKLN